MDIILIDSIGRRAADIHREPWASSSSRIAVRAALTGHLVLSTVHTDDCPSTITRLAAWASRPTWWPPRYRSLLVSVDENAPAVVPHRALPFVAQRLARRIALYELIPIKDVIVRCAPVQELRALAQAQSMRTLRLAGIARIPEETTTVDEMLRVILA